MAKLPSLPIFRIFTSGGRFLNYDDELKKYINISIYLETRDQYDQNNQFKTKSNFK